MTKWLPWQEKRNEILPRPFSYSYFCVSILYVHNDQSYMKLVIFTHIAKSLLYQYKVAGGLAKNMINPCSSGNFMLEISCKIPFMCHTYA